MAGLLSWLLLAATAVAHEGHEVGHDGGPNTLLIVITAAAALILALTMALFWLRRTGRI